MIDGGTQWMSLSAAVNNPTVAGCVEGTQGMLRPSKRLRNLQAIFADGEKVDDKSSSTRASKRR